MFSPGRLALARMRRRLTARTLGEKAGVSPVTLSRIENGVQNPDDDTVRRIARALNYPLEYFYQSDVDMIDPKGASFRSMSSMTASERHAALAAGHHAFDLAAWISTRFNLPEPSLIDWKTSSDPGAAARALRQYWSMGEKPVGHFIKLLESKGVRVFALAENTRTVDAFSYWRNGEPFIFLNTMKSAERSRFDAAHELGHLVMHRHGAPNGREAERQADQFASAFLMPEDDVKAVVPYVTTLAELVPIKKRWGVSLAALVYRLHKIGRISDWQNRGYFIQIDRDYASEPESMPREKSAVWQMVLTELWREGVTRHHIADQLHLPRDEVDTLLFGLTGESGPPTGDRPNLKAV